MATEENIGQYLDPYAFPATREDCITMAEANGAPDDFLDALTKLPEGVYETVHEVWALLSAKQEQT